MATLPRIVAKRWPDAGGVDVLVNNAGLSRNDASLMAGNVASWVEMLSTNVLGTAMAIKAITQVRAQVCVGVWVWVARECARRCGWRVCVCGCGCGWRMCLCGRGCGWRVCVCGRVGVGGARVCQAVPDRNPHACRRALPPPPHSPTGYGGRASRRASAQRASNPSTHPPPELNLCSSPSCPHLLPHATTLAPTLTLHRCWRAPQDMRRRGRWGHIINMVGLSGHRIPDGPQGGSFYCATKSAVKTITEGLRQEVG